jgi:antitoxin (DNA-binding transcriptional repressor) of toxin-antitoxin stability system
MTKRLAALALLLPLTALAQMGPGPGPRDGGPAPDQRIEKMEKRARLARDLGLAEALDLDTAQISKLSDALAKVDERRIALHKQLRDARQLLRRAADGEKVTAAEVDGALAKILDVRAQMNGLDKETLSIVTKDLSPEKKARAALFLGRFEQHLMGGQGPGMGPGKGMRDGRGGRGMRGPGRHGPGMGRGEMGMAGAPGACPNCPWDEDAE